MKKNVRLSEKLLLAGLSFIFIFMIARDWIPLGSLNDVEAIAEDRSFSELLFVTMFNATQILLLIGLVIRYMSKRYPVQVRLWLAIHQGSIFAGALLAWWIPYFFGYGAEKRVERYNQTFGDTHTFLPVMNRIAPNTIHTIFHLVLFFCIVLTLYISLTSSRKNRNDVGLKRRVSR